MAADPAGKYKVSCPLDILQKLRTWASRAVALGMGEDFASGLRFIQENLATVPLTWGEPRYSLPSGQGHVYQGAVRLLYATYSVHEAARVVFILDIGLMQNTSLTGGP